MVDFYVEGGIGVIFFFFGGCCLFGGGVIFSYEVVIGGLDVDNVGFGVGL